VVMNCAYRRIGLPALDRLSSERSKVFVALPVRIVARSKEMDAWRTMCD